MNNIILILVAIGIIALLGWLWWRKHIFNLAAQMSKNLFPVWAGQGPFENGTESAAAFKAAYVVVMGKEESNKNTDAFTKHQIAYDNDPVTWENLRKESITESDEINNLITMANGLTAMDRLNEDLLEGGGHRLELVTNEDGETNIAYKQIWTDEEIEKHNEETNNSILIGLGESLLKSDSPEAKELLEFLVSLYNAANEKEPESAKDIGNIFFNCITVCSDEPDDEICLEFQELYNAYSPNKDDSSFNWSDRPGAYEEHLKRRYNNPYFSNDRQNISNDDLTSAKETDEDDYHIARHLFSELLTEVENIGTSSTASMSEIQKIREKIDEVISFSIGVGGQAYKIAEEAKKLRESVISTMRDGVSNDANSLTALEKANAHHKQYTEKFNIPVIAQMMRDGSPIKNEDVLSTMLSEEPEIISIILSMFSNPEQQEFRENALALLQETKNSGYDDPQYKEKVLVLENN